MQPTPINLTRSKSRDKSRQTPIRPLTAPASLTVTETCQLLKEGIWSDNALFFPGQEDSSILPITGCFVSAGIVRSLRPGFVFIPEGVGTREAKSRPFPVIPVFMASWRACETEIPSRSPAWVGITLGSWCGIGGGEEFENEGLLLKR